MGPGLLWRKMPYQHSRCVKGTAGQQIPTWPWASVELLSKRSYELSTYRKDLKIDGKFRVLNQDSSKREVESFLDVESARLPVKGSVMTCSLTHHTHHHEAKSDIYPTHLVNFQGETQFVYTDVSCDSDGLTVEDTRVVCLLVGATSNVGTIAWDDDDSGEYIILCASI